MLDKRMSRNVEAKEIAPDRVESARAQWAVQRPDLDPAWIALLGRLGDAAAIVARELNIRMIETVCIASYSHENKQGSLQVIKSIAKEVSGNGDGKGVLVVDDLVDTGATAKLVRDMLPKAHFATVYAKPLGRPMVDTFITEVSQDTWIFFPWDTGLAFQPPINKVGA